MMILAWTDLDTWIVVLGVLSAVSAALLGNFLVLRRMSMLGDAVTHAVLPGIVVAFLISHSRGSLPMFLGAVIVGVLTAFFTEWIRSVGRVDEGASMGVVFTTLFALGIVLLVGAADHVDIHADCVLYGAIELARYNTIEFAGFELPQAAIVLAVVTLVDLCFVVLFFKELKISAFDPSLSNTVGISPQIMHYSLMVLVSVTAVASFESVGSILVVAMFVVPAAAAYMLTDRLSIMVLLSALLAILSAILGHVSAITLPRLFDFKSTTTAGMMAVVAGLLFLLAACFGPKHGVVIKAIRRRWLSMKILSDDIVAYLFRCEERAGGIASRQELTEELLSANWPMGFAIRNLTRSGEIEPRPDGYALTSAGRTRAQELVRSHRLWEQYLVSETDARTDGIHDKAHEFEHFTERELRDELDRATDMPTKDPHGSPIPLEREE